MDQLLHIAAALAASKLALAGRAHAAPQVADVERYGLQGMIIIIYAAPQVPAAYPQCAGASHCCSCCCLQSCKLPHRCCLPGQLQVLAAAVLAGWATHAAPAIAV
jgi:hypothetical protein